MPPRKLVRFHIALPNFQNVRCPLTKYTSTWSGSVHWKQRQKWENIHLPGISWAVWPGRFIFMLWSESVYIISNFPVSKGRLKHIFRVRFSRKRILVNRSKYYRRSGSTQVISSLSHNDKAFGSFALRFLLFVDTCLVSGGVAAASKCFV